MNVDDVGLVDDSARRGIRAGQESGCASSSI